MDRRQFDAVIVGAGQAGGPLAGALARAGRRTALIERRHVGGTCINEGCTPTKTMVASARVAYLARRAASYGVHCGPVQVDLAAVRKRKRLMVESFRTGGERRLEDAGVTLIRGQARFTGPRVALVQRADGTEEMIAGDLWFINTGARPTRPAITGLAEVPFLDSTAIMELDRVPDHLLVVGGGYVGLEFAQMFRRFGSAVTVIQHGPQLLGREDEDVAAAVASILREDGIEVLLDTIPARVASRDGGLRLTVRTPGGDQVLDASDLLIATGRTPNTENLDLPAAGVETDGRGFIRVNDRLETSVPDIYALGDVKGGPMFTHISYDDYRIIRANLLEGKAVGRAGRPVPYTVFIDPQLGRIGMAEKEARASGRPIGVARMPMSYVARALEVGETRGFMKVVVDLETQQILGAAILGLEGGEIMAMLQIAMMAGLAYPALRDGIFAHPTLAEALNNLFGMVEAA